MTDKTGDNNPVDSAESRHVLGHIPPASPDTMLNANPHVEQPAGNEPDGQPVTGLQGLQKKEPQGKSIPRDPVQDPQVYGAPAPGTSESDDQISLPDHALVAMRRSGGFRFTSRDVVVYRDGRVVVTGTQSPGEKASPGGRKLSDSELAELYRAIYTANFPELPPVSGHQSPDAYAYEIVTRVGQSTHSVETYDGSIPGQLDALIGLLSTYMSGTGQSPHGSAPPGA